MVFSGRGGFSRNPGLTVFGSQKSWQVFDFADPKNPA
jgi:hypothetical protein